jgi:hypothetical protein
LPFINNEQNNTVRLFGALVSVAVALSVVVRLGAQSAANADVVVVVDTSTSMHMPGMDPERTSLLVSKLLADVVPGQLAVVRLLDIDQDRDVIPSRGTGRFGACSEDRSRQCEFVDAANDWMAEAQRRTLGALVRPARGDAGFKTQLDSHLEQRTNNSLFNLAFSAARGIFDKRPPSASTPRTVVWLSDGRSDNEAEVKRIIGVLKASGVNVESVVFGRGDLRLSTESGLNATRVSTPAQLMKAFAGAFRRMVQAPYELDNQVAAQPAFAIKPRIDEAWIVVYGDDTLTDAWLTGPGGTVRADFARDRHPGAGAYRVAYLTRPPAGQWTVHVTAGGAGAAYAVIQRSGIVPALVGPATALAGSSVPLVAEVRASDGQPLKGDDLPPGLTLQATVEGRTIDLADDGRGGDTAGDGRFTAPVTFRVPGDAAVTIRARSDVLDRSVQGTVKVTGSFRYAGGPIDIDLGGLSHHSESCRPLTFTAEHQGTVPFDLRVLRSLPAAHRLEVRTARGVLSPSGTALPVEPGDALTVCLVTGAARSSAADGEPWIELRPAGATETGVTLRLRWRVEGLSWWAVYGWIVLLILGLLILAFVIYGFIRPLRFTKTLALVFVPDREDLEEQSPQPVSQWKGVGIGWYRDARAFLHPSYRVSGQGRGALASLHAVRGGTRVKPEGGQTLYREAIDGEWEAVGPDGRSIRPGEPYRVGDRGPFFMTSVRRS